jgi:hypothetical protein
MFKNKKYYNLMVNAVKLLRYLIPSLSDLTPSAPILLSLFQKKKEYLVMFKNKKYLKSMVNLVRFFRYLIPSLSDLAP